MALRTMFQQAAQLCSLSVNTTRAYSSKFINRVELLGRVGKEPQRVGTNEAVAFPFFTESSLKLPDGTVKQYPCWHKILVVRRSLANIVMDNVEKGQRCFISGRIAYKAGDRDVDGKMVHFHQAAILVDQIIFLDKSRKTAENTSETPEKIAETV